MHGLHPVRSRDPSDPIIPKARIPVKEGRVETDFSIRLWAFLLALAVLAMPVFSPDLFWHLSAGRWIWTHGSVPRTDPFSFTAFGAPWIDFEWLTQLLWFGVDRAAGLWGLWALKGVLVAAAFWPVDGLLRDKGATRTARVGALAFWCAAILAQADLRADLSSALFFALILRRLEARRASFLFGFGLFALWANLHAGFVMGLGLYALYALAAHPAPEGLAGEAAGAVLGSALNPYGLGLYRVLALHAGQRGLSRFVMEWSPPNWHHAYQIPLIAAALLLLAASWPARRRAPGALLAAAAVLALASLSSARFGAYFAAAGAAALFASWPRPRRGAVATGLGALTLGLVMPLRLSRLDLPFRDEYVARRAVDFVARQRAVLGDLRLFDQYEWGGYLGWRMGPDYRVFGDGRYLFLGELAEIQDALDSPDALAAFAARRRLDGFLIKDYPQKDLTVRLERDGTRRTFARPWYLRFFPRARWALVYWDGQALLFVDRTRVPAAWLSAHEYRWLLPGDGPARADALARGEIPRGALAAEEARERAEARRGAQVVE